MSNAAIIETKGLKIGYRLRGVCVTYLSNILMPFSGSNTVIPLNAITQIIGAPIIIYVILNRKNLQYFN